MTSGDLLELFRDEMADQATPYLWGDDLVFGYINDAQNRFCRLTDGISDATTAAVTQIAIAPAAQWYPYHSSITKLRQAYRADTGAPVDIINQEDMPTRGWRFDGSTGPLRALVLGIEAEQLRAYPVPHDATRLTAVSTDTAALGDVLVPVASTAGLYVGMRVTGTGTDEYTTISALTATSAALSLPATAEIPSGTTLTFDLVVQLSVFRKPLVAITDDQALEIPTEHQPHLLMWVKHRAYMKQDAETFDRTKAAEFKNDFEAYCFEVSQQQGRSRHKPRAVAYGGI